MADFMGFLLNALRRAAILGGLTPAYYPAPAERAQQAARLTAATSGMNPGGLDRDRIGRETRQSIRNQRAGRRCRDRHVGEIGRDYESLSWPLFSAHGTWRAHKDDWPCSGGVEKALTVYCLGCYHQAVKTFEELKLWNDMIFIDVPQHRRLVCNQCGGPISR